MNPNSQERPTPLRTIITVRLEAAGQLDPVAEVSEAVDTNAPAILGQQMSWITGTAAALYAKACAKAKAAT
jgi:hypothetical protein